MSEKDKRRRTSLLLSISFDAGATVRRLREALETTHNIAASADLIRADLSWLAEMGLIAWDGEMAVCTERGRDVAAQRAKFPGEA